MTFKQDEFKRYGDNGRVNREHMMQALSNIHTIMIRAAFVSSQYSVKLSEFDLDFAEERQISPDAKRATSIEVCECPEGYSGHSCEVSLKVF